MRSTNEGKLNVRTSMDGENKASIVLKQFELKESCENNE